MAWPNCKGHWETFSVSVSPSLLLYCQSSFSTIEAKKKKHRYSPFLRTPLVPVMECGPILTNGTKEKPMEGLLKNVFSTIKINTKRKCSYLAKSIMSTCVSQNVAAILWPCENKLTSQGSKSPCPCWYNKLLSQWCNCPSSGRLVPGSHKCPHCLHRFSSGVLLCVDKTVQVMPFFPTEANLV